MAKIQTKYKDKISTRYVCRSYKSNGDNKKICTAHSINENVLIKHILEVLNEQLKKYKDLERDLKNQQNKKVKVKSSKLELHIKELKKEIEKTNKQIDGYYDLLAEYKNDVDMQREYQRMRDLLNEKLILNGSLEVELKKCEEKLDEDPKLQFNNPVVKELMKRHKFTELTKDVMDSFVSTIFIHEELVTNPETKKEESNLSMETLFKFKKLE